MFKKVLAYVIVSMMFISCFTCNVNAEDNDYITLPVQLYDYDADGLFYEYALYNGMDTFGLGESTNEGVTTGLVENTLGEDGFPVYKKSSIESAAQTIHENLLSQKSNENLTKYSIFRKFAKADEKINGTNYGIDDLLGTESNYFYNRWSLDNVENQNKSNGQLYTGKGTVWQQETDGVINYGVNDHLTKTIEVETNKEYIFSFYRDNDELKYQIRDANNKLLLDNQNSGAKFTSTTKKITIDIYRDGNSNTKGKFAVAKVFPEGENADNYPNYLGNTNDKTNFLTEGWISKDYNASKLDSTKGTIVNGETYWKQVGDGVACLKDSSIVFNTDIPANQYVNIKYYLGYNDYAATGITIDLLDSNNTLLSHNTLKDETGGEYTLLADANNGEGKVKVRINGIAGSRIAAMKISPSGSVFPLGNYEETVRRNPTNVDECTTCMDYAYLRLNNFFNTKFYKNRKVDLYKQMLLKKNIKEDGTVEYTFDSNKETNYNDDKAVFYNNGDGENKGFFPLDTLLDDDDSEKLLGEDNQKHNYHFGMNVDGDFIYKKGSNQFFNFSGDDDVYVFINGQLVIDLGGAHKEASSSLDIEQYANDNGIKNGEKCHFQMFYLERHTTASNCKIQTNLKIGNHAEYKFTSGTEGKELPQEILDLVPVDENEYYTGDSVQVTNKNFREYIDTANKGVWKFVGWDKEEQTVTNNDLQFVGQWVFVPDDFKVKYNFISGTKDRELPQEILNLLPKDIEHLTRDQLIEVENNFKKEIRVRDGVWRFKTWDKDVVTIENKDEYFNGVWEFTPDNVSVKTENNTNSSNKKSAQVKTGDDAPIFIFISMLLVAFLGITIIIKRKVR